MDKRFLLFWLAFLAIWIGWIKYQEIMHPPKRPQKKVAKVEKKDAATPKPQADKEKIPAKAQVATEPVKTEPAVPLRTDLVLGRDDPGPESQHPLFARFTNKGAAVTYLHLNRFQGEKRQGPIVLLQSDRDSVPSFLFDVKGDEAVPLSQKTWEVVEATPERLVFRTTALGGSLVVEKRFVLEPGSYAIKLEIALKNQSAQPIPELNYTLTGGTGLPIEGEWYTRYYRNLFVVMKPQNGRHFWSEQTSSEIATNASAGKPITYSETPIQCVGIAVQYFASMIVQEGDPAQQRRIAMAEPLLVAKAPRSELSQIGVRVHSTPAALAPSTEVVHSYHLYNGPKEETALAPFDPYGLTLLIHYPDFMLIPIGYISKFMVYILGLFYSLVRDYGIAIILLTVVVRSALFPLSFKQAASIAKMQALQPKLEEIKQKFANDKERLQHEMMDLYRREKVNPLGGCLPLLLQLPIFIGLYQALAQSFQLRHTSFFYGLTWIDDLAAPDQLFSFGVSLPLLGPYFNLLPVLAVVQSLVQMKYLSPPVTSPEMALQKRMMTIMMVFFGVMFYSVPSGLCVYFITTGLWSLGERKFLPKSVLSPAAATGAASSAAAAPAPTNGTSWKAQLSKKKGRSRR